MDLIKKVKKIARFQTLSSEFLYITLEQRDISLNKKLTAQDKSTFNYDSIKDIMMMKSRETDNTEQ